MKERADIAIIGAGVVGLAIAAQLARAGRRLYVLERNDSFGLETSSRHSGVIHAGIYYPAGSLKAGLCVSGNRMLYELCQRYGIPHRQTGKLIVAGSEGETAALQSLLQRGQDNGAQGLRLLSGGELKKLQPGVGGAAALLSPSSGIIDSHALMGYFIASAQERGASIAYRAEVVGIDKAADGYEVTVDDGSERYRFTAGVLINCAGLHSDRVAALAGIDPDGAGYRLHYCKGEYFSLGGRSSPVDMLVYPLPPPDLTSVGIHLTFDLQGRARLGPGMEYVEGIDYSVDGRNKRLFYESTRRFLPAIEYDDLQPEMAGIRPKLQLPGEAIRDFVIREESDRGLPGLIDLIGIESPGLTAAPAIADYVRRLVD